MRRVEKKLKQSLNVITPKQKRSRKNHRLQYRYLFGTLLLAVTCYFFMTPTLSFNELKERESKGIKPFSNEEVQLEKFPWQESNNIIYQYQQSEGVLSITWTESNEDYILTLQQTNLLVESTDKETMIEHQKVYLYQKEERLKAKWQHGDYVVTLEGVVPKTHFGNKIKKIIKENLQ